MKKRLVSMVLTVAMLASILSLGMISANAVVPSDSGAITGIALSANNGTVTAEITGAVSASTVNMVACSEATGTAAGYDDKDGFPASQGANDYAFGQGDSLDGSKKKTYTITVPAADYTTSGVTVFVYVMADTDADNVYVASIELDTTGNEPVDYTVSFNTNGGSGTANAVHYTGTDPVSAPTGITQTGYRLDGWTTTQNNASTKVTFPYTPTGDITLYALWTKVYEVSFDANTGTGTATAVTVAPGESVTLPTTGFTKTGYTFAGWATTNNATSALPSYALPNDASADVTLYAVWTPIPVTLTASNITVKTNNAVNVTLPEATPTAGYTTTFTYTATVKAGDTLPAGLTLSTSAPFTLTGTPTAEGEATIEYTATDDTNGASKKVEIKVTVSDKDPASILGVPSSPVEGKVGGSVTPVITTNSTKPLTFSSSDEDIVTVDATGKLTFKAEGDAVITVSVAEDDTYAANSKTFNVKVVSAAAPHAPFMKGYESDGKTNNFGPDDQLTRAQAVTILARLDGWTDGQTVTVDNMYSDVKNVWYYNAIAYAKKNGIVEGYEDGTFQPDKAITRAEFSKMLARMSNGSQDPTGYNSALSDAKAHWANVWIGYLETEFPGSITGREDGLFHPNDDITRAEVAKIVNAYQGRLQSVSAKEADQLAADLNKFDDVKRCTWYYNNVIEATVAHDASDVKFHTAG